MPATQARDDRTARSKTRLGPKGRQGKKRKEWCVSICREAAKWKGNLVQTVSRFGQYFALRLKLCVPGVLAVQTFFF